MYFRYFRQISFHIQKPFFKGVGMHGKVSFIAVIWVFLLFSFISGQVKLISADSLKALINDCRFESDYILIDVRDNSEVATGIIASDYAKPYHMSWNTKVLENNYTKLPQNLPIYIYCRSGVRSQQAANFLISQGFSDVYSMTGGIISYTGDLHDSSELIILNSLPQPSFSEGNCPTALKRTPLVRNQSIHDSRLSYFTLQGRMVGQPVQSRSSQVYILRKSKGNVTSRILGILSAYPGSLILYGQQRR